MALATGICAAVWLFRRRHHVFLGLLAFFAAGIGLGSRAVRPPALPEALVGAMDRGERLVVEGRLVRPLRHAAGEVPMRALVETARIAGAPVRYHVAVSAPAAHARPDDRVRFTARLNVPDGPRNPGRPDPTLAARAQGIDLVAWVPEGALVIEAAGRPWSPRRLAQRAHEALAATIDAGVTPPHRPLVKALVLGERSAAGDHVEAGFRAAGAVHALSVSGLHLTAVAAVIFFGLRRALAFVPRSVLRVQPSTLAAALAMPAVLFYCALTGEATATRRAAIMCALGFGALVVRRVPALASAFGASAIVILLDAPLLLADASFQLSFASLAAVGLAGRRFNFEPGLPVRRRALTWLGRGLAVSTVAFAATAPLVAHHFAELAPASPLGNLVLVPPVELGIVPLGLLGATLGAIWAPLGGAPLFAADLLVSATLWLAERFRAWAPVVPVPSPSALEAALAFVSLMIAVAAFTSRNLRARRRAAGLAAALFAVAAAHLGARWLSRRLDDGVCVTFLDVGQGDAALIEGPRGFVALVDGGGAIAALGGSAWDPGARVIEPVLRRKLIRRLDLVVLSHPHPDHMNGLLRIGERFAIDRFWSAGDGAGNPVYDRLLEGLRARGVHIEAPWPLAHAGLVFEPRGPWVGDVVAAPPGLDANDASVVLRLGFAGRRVLFTGDIEAQGEAELLGRYRAVELASDVLKVPHHGSRTSSGPELLAAVAPRHAVFSLGRRNRFGFPRPEVLARYEHAGVVIHRTDREGALAIHVSPDGVLHATSGGLCRE